MYLYVYISEGILFEVCLYCSESSRKNCRGTLLTCQYSYSTGSLLVLAASLVCSGSAAHLEPFQIPFPLHRILKELSCEAKSLEKVFWSGVASLVWCCWSGVAVQGAGEPHRREMSFSTVSKYQMCTGSDVVLQWDDEDTPSSEVSAVWRMEPLPLVSLVSLVPGHGWVGLQSPL